MATTDLLLYGLLAFIALLLAITILIMLRRHWPNRRTQKPSVTTPATLQGEGCGRMVRIQWAIRIGTAGDIPSAPQCGLPVSTTSERE